MMDGTRFAEGTSLFKRAAGRAAGLFTLVCVLLAGPTDARAQAPDEDWRTLTTEHFRVTFPEHLEALGRASAARAERAWTQLDSSFIQPPDGLIDILVTDHADVSNGFAQVTPSNRITVFARPPVDAFNLGYMDDWLELVITHELAHIVHLDHQLNPIGTVARAVFGRVPAEWPFFPELGTPGWVIEGLATWYESALTEAGRVRGTFHEMQMRTAALEGRFENIGQAGGESPLWPGGNRPYAYGSLFFEFLLERHGEERMADFADAVAGQWIPYRLDAAGRDAFGVSLTDEWRVWGDSLRASVADLDARLERIMPITVSEALTEGARWGLLPTPSPDGRWIAYTRSDGRSDIQLRVLDPVTGEDRSLGRTNGLSTFDWLSTDELLVSQLERDGPYRLLEDLYVFDLEGGQRRLTRNARLGQPSVAPGGTTAIAVRQGEGTTELVRVDLASGTAESLVPPTADIHWAFPSVSPDGRWVAATRWAPDANHDVVILDAVTGAVATEVTSDRALDMGPRWSPDGRRLVWASDRSGILNILSASVDPATAGVTEPALVTNVRTGAAYPAIDPSGDWLYYSAYHVDGWEIERTRFEPDRFEPAPPALSRFDPDGPFPVRGEAPGDVRNYSAFSTVRPMYWELSYSDPVESPALVTDDVNLRRRELLGFGLGVQTEGRDLVGRHAYSAFARVTTTGAKFEGGFSYTWAGLGNPLLSLVADQSWTDGGQQVAGPEQDTLFILERERFVEGAVTILAPTYRRGLSFTLSSGLVWEDRSLLDVFLEPSSEYALSRPSSRLTDVSASVNFNSSRTHSFQMGTSAGLAVFVLGRWRHELDLPAEDAGVAGVDRSLREVLGRVRGAIPLWGGGFARHVLAFQASGGIAEGPGAGPLQYRVGGTAGQKEAVTGLELFGGDGFFFPVRGYDTSSRFGRIAWAASAEYRFPLWLINQGFRAWPLHVDRAIGSVFLDAGNAWGPDVSASGFENPLGMALASVGVEVTTEFLMLYDIQLRVRGGVAQPLVDGSGTRFYVRVGLPY